MILTGTVVTMDDADTVIDDGAVFVDDNGLVAAVQSRSDPEPDGFDDADTVHTGELIFPGLVDLHHHLAYSTLPLWRAPRDDPYDSRNQWPNAATYTREISNPAQAYGVAAPAAALRFAEVKAAIGGVTAVQGSPPMTRVFPGWMLRNIEKESFDADAGGPKAKGMFRQSVRRRTPEELLDTAEDLDEGRAFAYHLAEGTDRSLHEEYVDLRDSGCLHDGLVGIHSTALNKTQIRKWGRIGGTVVWSPFSNIWLYGDTTDVVTVAETDLRLCIGNDWSPSATRNMLGELKVAAIWNQEHLSGAFSARDLCAMVTANPGDTLARVWQRPVGRLVPGALADLCVVRSTAASPYESLVQAREVDVRLVVVGGRPAYGLGSLMADAGATSAEPISFGRLRRAVQMRLPDGVRPSDPDLAAMGDLSWADGMAQLQSVVDDPAQAVRDVRARRPRAGARSRAPEPFAFTPDMPGPTGDVDARRLDDDELDTLVVPPLEGLTHDRDFFDRLEATVPDHARILLGLRDWF